MGNITYIGFTKGKMISAEKMIEEGFSWTIITRITGITKKQFEK